MKNNNYIEINNISKSFELKDGKLNVFENLNLTIEKGNLVSILGKSGCGKTTLLRCIGGFEPSTKGNIFIDGKEVLKPNSKVIMIFQSPDQLFTWQSVKGNIINSIKAVKKIKDKKVLNETADNILKEVGLYDFKDYYPNKLSGGMKQRAALARALSLEADVLLMDEPFASLDSFTRKTLQDLVIKICKTRKITAIFVTHSIEEAIKISDKLVLMDGSPCNNLIVYELNKKNKLKIKKEVNKYFDLKEED